MYIKLYLILSILAKINANEKIIWQDEFNSNDGSLNTNDWFILDEQVNCTVILPVGARNRRYRKQL